MGRGANFNELSSNRDEKSPESNFYSWNEIKSNKWIVINEKIYDIEKFSKKHPGGERLMMNHVAQDATDAFNAFHTDMKKVNKYMKAIEIGRLMPNDSNNDIVEESRDELTKDFRALRQLAQKMNLFETNFNFFAFHFLSIVFMDLIAMLIIQYSGYNNWFTYMIAVLLLVTSQAQAGWLQHDFGHLSVFTANKMNHLFQRIVICTIKGVSADWWNYRHFQHHAKPNTVKKDPDIRFGSFLVLGKIIPRELGEKKVGKLPYQYQHNYFFMIVPSVLLPIYFNIEQIYFLIKKKNLSELAWAMSFLVRWCIQYGPSLGILGALGLYILVRSIESHWFVWTTQMSHLPMNIDRDYQKSWFRTQLMATCNVEQSLFNDWFSGHLNFQIEHHLFPTMPRHNYHKIAPYVKSMCKKHNIDYIEKPLSKAMIDIYGCLKESGELWYEAYNM
jgi:fatty acid desaturase